MRGTLSPSCMLAEGFSVREHYLSSYRAAFVSILKAQLMPLRGMNGGEAAVRAFAADRHMNALCTYLGAHACWRTPPLSRAAAEQWALVVVAPAPSRAEVLWAGRGGFEEAAADAAGKDHDNGQEAPL